VNWIACKTAAFSQADYDRVYRQLTPARKAHIDRFRLPGDKTRSLAGQLLAEKLLAETFGLAGIKLDRADSGCPILQGSDLHISIAHSEDLVACAVSEKPIGIDVEKLRPIDLGAARHVCVAEEMAYLTQGKALPERGVLCRDPELLKRFYEIWTAKEAYFKKCGTGITNLKSVNILPMERQCFQIEDYFIQIL